MSAAEPQSAGTATGLLASETRAADESPNTFLRIGFFLLLINLFLIFSRIVEFRALLFTGKLHLAFIVSSLACAAAFVTGRIVPALFSRAGILFSAFTLWLMISMPFSVWRGGSVGLLLEWMRSFLIFVMAAALLAGIESCRRAMHTLAYALPPILLLAAGLGTSGDDRFRLAKGTFGNSNDLATHLLIGLPFALFVVWNDRRPVIRLLGGAIIPPLLFIVLRTGSRGALITLVAMGLLVFLRLSMTQKVIVTSVFLLTAGVLYHFVPARVKARYATIFMKRDASAPMGGTEASALESKEGRIQLLKASLRATLENPLLGVGPGQFSVAYTKELNNRGIYHHTYRETHNAYTQISSEDGLPALLLYVAVLVHCFRSCDRLYRKTRGKPGQEQISRMAVCLMLALVAFAVTAIFTSSAYMFYLPLLAGLCTAFRTAAEAKLPGLVPAWQPLTISAQPRGTAWAPPPALAPNTAAMPVLPRSEPLRRLRNRAHLN